ncbi:DUF6518 family protein [Salinibacterium hongtaonis]|uniref:DUF6518 family protein n=1 Tax=Homoserinimonas hongtaonis TaxID=2079791 RepID=UPI000D388DDA|nr:DUF6518 family protein [Salinibacterium hongtaonis]AWB89550.1 hypothetical protein C2138_08355 [Salinibacterium hongtaonis]
MTDRRDPAPPDAAANRSFLVTDKPHTPAGTLAIALCGGALLGAVAWALAAALPFPWHTLATTSALWGLVAAGFVILQRASGTLAVVTGALALLGMTGTYALLTQAPLRSAVIYLVVGAMAGALFGLAASVLSSTRWQDQTFAAGVLGGIVGGEGLYGIAVIDSAGPQWWTELALGLIIAALIGRGRRRMLSVATAAMVAALLLSAYSAYDSLMVG